MSEEKMEQDMTASEVKDGEQIGEDITEEEAIKANAVTSTEESQPGEPPSPREVAIGDSVMFADQHGKLFSALVRHIHGPTLINLCIISPMDAGSDSFGNMIINHTSVPKGGPSDTDQGVPAFYWCWGWEVPDK